MEIRGLARHSSSNENYPRTREEERESVPIDRDASFLVVDRLCDWCGGQEHSR